MRRLLLISLATIPLTGCQFFNRDGNTVVDIVESVESGEALGGVSIPELGGGEDKASADDAFKDPTIASKPNGVVTVDLIRSTDPDARAKAVSRSRVDPFATLPILPNPVVIVPEGSDRDSNAGARAAGNSTGGSRAASNNAANNNGRGSGGGAAAAAAASAKPAPTPPPVRVQAPNKPLVVPSPIAALPTIPQPVIAPTISVSGVIQLGSEPYAIVRSGSEPERYVKVGDRIGGGSVRVKRIETLAFEPRVILEENGIEVIRPITGGGDNDVAAVSGSSASGAIAVPVAAIPAVPGALPTIPTAAVLSSPGSVSGSLTQPAAGFVPNSLLLQSPESSPQAVLPNFQVPVPNRV